MKYRKNIYFDQDVAENIRNLSSKEINEILRNYFIYKENEIINENIKSTLNKTNEILEQNTLTLEFFCSLLLEEEDNY